MGKARRNFRLSSGFVCAVCAVVASCRSGGGSEVERPLLASGDAVSVTSLVIGHRFGRWLEVVPEPSARASLENACLLEQTGATEQAIGVLGDALEEVNDAPSLYLARGALYVSAGFPRAAAGDLQRAVALDPDNATAWYALGHAYETLSLARQALESLERATNLGLDTAELHLSLARVYRSLGRRGMAARHYELSIALEPNPALELLVEAAVLPSEDREKAQAVEALRDRLETCRGVRVTDQAWLLRALLQESPGELPESVAAYVQALELAPGELESITASLLTALQLHDAETRVEVRARVLAAETNPDRRLALEKCLALK